MSYPNKQNRSIVIGSKYGNYTVIRKTKRYKLGHYKTGQIRNFICSKCNWGLGCFNDSPLYLTRAIKYLKEYNGNSSGLRSK